MAIDARPDEPVGPAQPTAPAPAAEAESAAALGEVTLSGAALGVGPRAAAVTVGRSPLRRTVGMIGQYAVLVALAVVVLAPIALVLIQALSSPIRYIAAGLPLHPVGIDWKDRTWWSGGAASVILRSLVILVALVWLQLRVAGGRIWELSRFRERPVLALAVAAGWVAVVLTTNPIFAALADGSSNAPALVLVAVLVVGATQLIGFRAGARSWWAALILAALAGVGLVAVVVICFGAAVWTDAWTRADLGPAMVQSLILTILITAAQLVTATLAAYAFTFLRFPLKGLLFAFFLGTLLLPLEVTLLANEYTVRQLGWTDTYQGLVAPFAASAFGTFLVRQGFRGVPPEIRDAAQLDGYGHLSFLWRFAIPLTRPVIASFTVIAALAAWNQYLWPRAIIDQASHETAQIRLRTLVSTEVAQSNQAIAAALIVAVPVVLLLIAFQRQIIRGLTAGAVKG